MLEQRTARRQPPDTAAPGQAQHCGKCPRANEPPPMTRRIAIIGIPNSGKSLLFHKLTGRFNTSANYPYTTQEVLAVPVRLGSERLLLLDTPGMSDLEHGSEEEVLTRSLLRDEPPDLLLLCMDAGHLVRSLLLAAQVADLEIPTVACLNMVDEALGRGQVVDAGALGKELGVPVVPVCALDGRGLDRLTAEIPRARPLRQVRYPAWLQRKLDALTPVASRAQRMDIVSDHGAAELLRGQNIGQMVQEAHRHWATEVTERVTSESGLEPGVTVRDRLNDLALHPVGGLAVLAAVMAAVYLLVSEVGVGLLADGLERLVVAPVCIEIASWTGPGLLRQVLVGPFGLLSLGLFNALCTVVPILTVFYLFYGFLEDVGYFPVLSVHLDRLLRWVGLTGKAVLPIALGFGCNTVGTLASRCLRTKRQRLIACFVISLSIPCAVQLGVMVAILSGLPATAVIGLLVIVVGLQVVAGTTLARVLPKSEQGELLIELPPLRPPRWRYVCEKTFHRVTDFSREAIPAFIASAMVLLALELTGLLERIRSALAPVVVSGLGLPREAADMLLMTLARREVGAVMLKEMVDRDQLDLQQTFVGLLVMTLFVPCVSNTVVMGRVIGWPRSVAVFVAVMAIALGAGVMVNGIWSSLA